MRKFLALVMLMGVAGSVFAGADIVLTSACFTTDAVLVAPRGVVVKYVILSSTGAIAPNYLTFADSATVKTTLFFPAAQGSTVINLRPEGMEFNTNLRVTAGGAASSLSYVIVYQKK